MQSGSPESMQSTRVLIVDDHALVRAGVRALVEKIDRVEVVAETGDGHEVIPLTQQYQPEIVLLDLSLPGVNAFDIIAHLARTFPSVKVIVVSGDDSEAYAAQAFRAGAVGYLPKSASETELVLALDAVRKGGEYLPQSLSRKVFFEQLAAASNEPAAMPELTPRQHQVLKLVAEGYSTREIAQALQISIKTVESHRTQMMERLNIHDVARLVRYAIRTGMVKVEGYEGDVDRRKIISNS
jgi:DNA-binding NarL/FixJ family response regulator